MDDPKPKDHREEVAVFRHGLIGELAIRELSHGERSATLRRISEQRVRPPNSDNTRCYAVPTLERWLYAFKRGGLKGLEPRGRGDRGRGRELAVAVRELLCDIRRERPEVSVPIILRTLRKDGRIGPEVTACTVRRMFAERGLHRSLDVADKAGSTRLRWQADRPGALWHGDVCHGPTVTIGTRRTPVRVHGLLDDASRYVVALRVFDNEREETMLSLLSQAVMEHGRPDALYLDNGSTYRGEVLRLVCSRLGVSLLHAKPGDAPARGKMERFWRRLREEALSHVGHIASLADVEAKLRAWLSRYYHLEPHAGLVGRAPATVFAEGEKRLVPETELRDALTVRTRRRVRRDTTVSIDGTSYEVPLGYLAGHVVSIVTSLFDAAEPALELGEKRVPLRVVDPTGNSKRRRPPKRPVPDRPKAPVDFDPSAALVDQEDDDALT